MTFQGKLFDSHLSCQQLRPVVERSGHIGVYLSGGFLEDGLCSSVERFRLVVYALARNAGPRDIAA